jgi:histidinol-phosphate aminotransferase
MTSSRSELTTARPTVSSLGFRDSLLRNQAYLPEWSDIDRRLCLRLDRNEGTRPIPQSVAMAINQYIANHGVHTYPDAERLVDPLSAYCGVPPEFILPTNGSDQAIDLTLRAFLSEGRRMLVAQPEFPVFGHVARIAGASVVGVPYQPDLGFPYAAFREAASSLPDLIVIINPNNPTGTLVDTDFIEGIVTSYPGVPVVVDEAYYEFTGNTVVELIKSHENLIVFRTFSKAFAMAGLRLGYAVASPSILAEITKLRNPFDVNELAVVAGEAHLRDIESSQAYVRETMNVIKPMVVDFFATAGVKMWPGAANFLLVKPSNCEEAVTHLRSSRILVRPMRSPLLAGTFRMSLGSYEEMSVVVDVYDQYLRQKGKQ